jgi:hypothetical protein
VPKHDNLDEIVASALRWEEKLLRHNAKAQPAASA